MRTFELRVYKLRTKRGARFLHGGDLHPRHLSSFPLFGIEDPRLRFGPPRRMS